MLLTSWDKALWAAGLLGHTALLLVLVLRGRWRQFPVFSVMVSYQVVVTVVLYGFAYVGTHRQYYLAYWISAFVDFALQAALIFEIARIVLRPAKTWVQDARNSFLAWSAVGLALAAAVAYFVGPSNVKGLDFWMARATLFNSVLTLELFLSMSSAANRLGIPWRSHVMALGQGIAAVAVLYVLADVFRMFNGWPALSDWLDRVGAVVYLAALTYWIASFWLPERVRAPLSDEMQEYLLALHRRVQYDLERQSAENSL